ncbi:MAG: hypothetical protein JXR68_02985 [Bacteroidales bacterium]|nr:hypothetical protein [Bacteroidales bacterium]
MKFLTQIFSFLIITIFFISTSGINIKIHTCTSCGIIEEKIGFISTQAKQFQNNNHSDIRCSKSSNCCTDKHILTIEHNKNPHNHSCCNFKNVFLKISDVFSTAQFIEIFKINIFYKKINFDNEFTKIINSTHILTNRTLKILNSKLILDLTCKLVL